MTNYLIIEKENSKGEIDQIIIPTNLLVIEQSGQMTYIHTINGLTYKFHSSITVYDKVQNFPLFAVTVDQRNVTLAKEWLVK